MRGDAFQWFVRGAALALGAALAVGILYILLLGLPIVLLVFVALLLASALEPLIDRIRTRTPLQRGASLLVVYVAFFAGLAALVLLIVPSAINQFSDVGAKIGPLLDNARNWAATLTPQPVSVALTGLIDSIQHALEPSSTQAPPPDQLLQLGFTAAEAVISIVSVLTLVYFWLTERAHLQRFALALLPADRRQGAREAWNQIELRLGGWVRGQLILMGFVGVEFDEDERWLTITRGRVTVAFNLGDFEARIAADPCHIELASSDAVRFENDELILPPDSVAILVRD